MNTNHETPYYAILSQKARIVSQRSEFSNRREEIVNNNSIDLSCA